MSSCATQVFSGITQGRFDCLVEKAKDSGITIAGNAGEQSQDGVTIRWQFDSAKQSLELQCTGAPFFLSCETINGRIHDLVEGCP
jgi:hypothetical protein